MKRRAFTLIEMTIALTIFGVVCGLFFSLFYSFTFSNQHVKERYARNEELEVCHVKLKSLFNAATFSRESSSACFFLKRDKTHPSLYFSTDNGVDPHPLFSSTVIAALTVDSHQQLLLTLWPDFDRLRRDKLQDSPPQRSLCLLKDIQSVSYRFLAPPLPPDKIPQSITPTEFSSDWPKELGLLPAAIEITIKTKEEKEYILSYLIPETLQNIQMEM